jgi:hypothetical protein
MARRKSAILEFVHFGVAGRGPELSSHRGSDRGFFDNDGTLWCEEADADPGSTSILRRLREMAEADPSSRAPAVEGRLERDYALARRGS